jgi:hypothetical protein
VITGRKLWFAEPGVDVDKAFRVFEIPSRQAELVAIIRLAMEFADQETALPQIAQGEQGAAPETVGGMTLLMNAANTVLKRLARQYDDMVTKPHISRYYDWLMQYHPSDEIKGDYEVAARGSTALVTRDMRNQNLDQVIAAATHPVFGAFLNHKALFRAYLEAKSITPDDVMLTDTEIMENAEKAAKAGPPKSPQEKVAEIRAQADVKKIEIDTKSEATNEKLRQENAQRDREHDVYLTELKLQLAVMDHANEQKIAVDTIKANLAAIVLKQQGSQSINTENNAARERTEAQRAAMKQRDAEPALA